MSARASAPTLRCKSTVSTGRGVGCVCWVLFYVCLELLLLWLLFLLLLLLFLLPYDWRDGIGWECDSREGSVS